MKSCLSFACLTLFTAVVCGASMRPGRDLSTNAMERIHGGATHEDACCREFLDCQPNTGYIAPCSFYTNKFFCIGRIHHEKQSGNDESCMIATEFDPYQCTLSDTDHICLIEYHCNWDPDDDECYASSATNPPQEVATTCTDTCPP
jgi:hypothetical protein